MKRSGFATIVALFLVGLVTAALAVVAAGVVVDGRRTRAAVAHAQLRQLLLAAAADVVARSADWPPQASAGRWTLAVPKELAAAGFAAAVRVQAGHGDAVTRITATGDGSGDVEQLQLTRASGRWSVVAARLDDEP